MKTFEPLLLTAVQGLTSPGACLLIVLFWAITVLTVVNVTDDYRDTDVWKKVRGVVIGAALLEVSLFMTRFLLEP